MNPFIQNFKLKLIQVNETTKVANVNDIQDGYVLKFRKEIITHHIEQQEKISVYEIPYINNILFKELKPCGRDLLFYIVYNLHKDQDFINLKYDRVSSKIKLSKPTLISAISQLQDVAILCRKSQSEYWVNPFFFFKGNRIAFYNGKYPDCIEVVAKINKESDSTKS